MRRRLPAGIVLAALVCAGTVAPAVASPTTLAPSAPTSTSVHAEAAQEQLARHRTMLVSAQRVLQARVAGYETAQARLLLDPGADVDVARAERGWRSVRTVVQALTVVVALDEQALVAARTGGTGGQGAVAEATALLATVSGGGAADVRALSAVQFALGQLGEPYAWGGNGPDRWDCSGLVQQAYRSAGVAVPRTSRQQVGAGPRVARADLLPGDLVFLARDPSDLRTVHHVGLYVGDGLMVHAPRTGDVVRIARVPTAGYAGGVRVVAATTSSPVQPVPADPGPMPDPTSPDPTSPGPMSPGPTTSPGADTAPTAPTTTAPTTTAPTTTAPTAPPEEPDPEPAPTDLASTDPAPTDAPTPTGPPVPTDPPGAVSP